jgi:MFS family permease
MLAIFRALQGLGAAFVMPAALSIVTNTFRKSRKGTVPSEFSVLLLLLVREVAFL